MRGTPQDHLTPGVGCTRGMTGAGPVITAVTSPCPLLAEFIPQAPAFPRVNMGAVTKITAQKKTATDRK